MKSLLVIAGAGLLAVLALVFVFGTEAAASAGPSCAPSAGFIPQLCVNVPVGTSVRRETTVPLSTVLTARADVRVEAGVPAPGVARLASSVDGAVVTIERVFDRPFATKPRILVFATRASFARGTQDLFGYAPETAANVAASYGGVFDPQTLTIAVSWESTPDLPSLLAHELTHLATREIVGRDGILPAWFEEGLAARIESGDTTTEDARLAARSLLANAPHTVDTIATLADWHRAYPTFGPALYAVSAETVRNIETQLGRGGVFGLLTDVGAGARFEDAYRARSGEKLDEFFARLTLDLATTTELAVGEVDKSGDLTWTLGGFSPNSEVQVTITGRAYELAFTVRADAIGTYRGSFGSTAAKGTYTLTAESAGKYATGTLDTAR
jgi:hypothetical protein